MGVLSGDCCVKKFLNRLLGLTVVMQVRTLLTRRVRSSKAFDDSLDSQLSYTSCATRSLCHCCSVASPANAITSIRSGPSSHQLRVIYFGNVTLKLLCTILHLHKAIHIKYLPADIASVVVLSHATSPIHSISLPKQILISCYPSELSTLSLNFLISPRVAEQDLRALHCPP